MQNHPIWKLVGVCALAVLAGWATVAHAHTRATVIAQFGPTLGPGLSPFGSLVADSTGSLYGVTISTSFQNGGPEGYGTVFKLLPPAAGQTAWTRQVLHVFQGSASDGGSPRNLVLLGGNVYGTSGGVFELSPPAPGQTAWSSRVIAVLGYGHLGLMGLLAGTDGNLYVSCASDETHAYGRIDQLTAPTTPGGTWGIAEITRFTDDDQFPNGSLIMDEAGSLYGVTMGSASPFAAPVPGADYGTVFKLTPPVGGVGAWKRATLYRFQGGLDGAWPQGALVRSMDGTLYGVTEFGGSAQNDGAGFGEAFAVAPPRGGATGWSKTTLHAFLGADGAFPVPLVGSAERGFFSASSGGFGVPDTIFRLVPPAAGQSAWSLVVLHNFTGVQDGVATVGALLSLPGGRLYSTEEEGGDRSVGGGYGTVLQLQH